MKKNVAIDELVPGMFIEEIIKQDHNCSVKSVGLVKSFNNIELLRRDGITNVLVDFERSHTDLFTLPELETLKESQLDNVAARYPVGSLVSLSDNRLAIVSYNDIDDDESIGLMIFYDASIKSHCPVERIEVSPPYDLIAEAVSPNKFNNELNLFIRSAFMAH